MQEIKDRAASLAGLALERDAIFLYDALAKIEKDPAHPEAIRTVRGVGYMFVPAKD